ncbi:MAG: T9SS type A sorting domain-containing protein [candidate division WOR-3 bacterium]|nr:MAG: T9SS type A sorting domain-containing protein [candidate division WOR-3 bacterium]
MISSFLEHRKASKKFSVCKNLMHIFLMLVVAVFLLTRNLRADNFIVTNSNDTGAGSLRAAIDSANYTSGFDTISFAIPTGWEAVIALQSELPALTDTSGVLVDGASQPLSSIQTDPLSLWLTLILDGSSAGPAHGIVIRSSHNIVQGIVFNNFEQDAIRLEPTITGTDSNTIFANNIGVEFEWGIAMGNGTNQNELWAGVHIAASPADTGTACHNVIEYNMIGCNYADGVRIEGNSICDISYNTIRNNYLGWRYNYDDYGNLRSGAYIGKGTHNNLIEDNLIVCNDYDGVTLVGDSLLQLPTFGNTITHNTIGDYYPANYYNEKNGVGIGVYGGIDFQGYAYNNTISQNAIYANGENGIAIWEHPSTTSNADGNKISQNYIRNNQGLGIDLGVDGVTYNDTNDIDTGANQEVNYPIILNAMSIGWWPMSATIIADGIIEIDTDPEHAVVEIFFALCDSTGFGEGYVYLTSVTPDSHGNWSTVTHLGPPPIEWLTATVTDVNMNTSEYSLCKQISITAIEEREDSDILSPPCYLSQNTPNPFSDRTSIRFGLTAQTNVNLTIYDVTGARVKELINASCTASQHTIIWDGCDDRGRYVPPGVYLYCLRAGDDFIQKKMVLVD